ncbi:metallo-beta-lactamase superfamily protein [Colletotrichum graminicola]|uniref:Metallo-beta-lactamase superfamily protein n=1 Tax=Colletotrichum graminicola (strain M1.001 / M2 / FGSC 10212) TaxID=645133 RepID=E3QS66_COLGM|nr:metallo-beta-lactamase superfamily protein [Colletotrichum graminicola M1.001]EFQ33704.1 metallo-beta-lactamase superfamily protein [Colletotrichum graminicola M1.001]WDK10718.1 metallo-beta-lactamase superfamily protein [Colletotrichum graminicola]
MATLANVKIDREFWKDYLSTQASRLPHLDDVEDVTDRVIRVMGGNPGEMQLQGTNTFLVGTGKARILIDTGEGVPVWIERLVGILKERDLIITHVLLTHWHGDHTGGVPDLVAYDSAIADRVYKCNPDPGQNDIEDGQIFAVEGATIKALFTPGHAVDHMCFFLEEENALFTGDNVLGHGFTVVEDLAVYLQSLDRMAEQGCTIGYPAHGIEIQNLPAKLNQYIRQRRAREKLIYGVLLDSMSNGGRNTYSKSGLSTREIISKVHGDVPAHLLQSAIEPSTMEILRMLADTRKVGFIMQGGTQRWFVNKTCKLVVA